MVEAGFLELIQKTEKPHAYSFNRIKKKKTGEMGHVTTIQRA